jgi:hypothetical protein
MRQAGRLAASKLIDLGLCQQAPARHWLRTTCPFPRSCRRSSKHLSPELSRRGGSLLLEPRDRGWAGLSR